MTLFAGGLMVVLWERQQTELTRSLHDTSRAVSLAVDREVETSIKQLEVLSNQPSFVEQRWPDFLGYSRQLVAASEDWDNLLVFSADGEPLINVLADTNSALPGFDSYDYAARVVAENRPIISDLFVSPTTGEQVVHVAVPIVSGDQTALVLAAALNLTEFDRLLSDELVPDAGVAAIFDRELRHIARIRDPQNYRGKRPIAAMHEAMQLQPEGTGRFVVDDGPEVYMAWTRSPLTGWTVNFGVPSAPVEAGLRRSLVMLAEAGLVVVLVTVLIALHLSRQLAKSMAAATESAMALAKREPNSTLESNVVELNVLGSALERAGEILEHESNERARVEREREQLLVLEQQARQDAEDAGRAKDEFLAMLGHELRNPLAPILFAVELAKGHVDPPSRELEVIERQAKHIERLVNDLLDVARIVQGKISLKKRVDEVHPIISKAVEIAAPLLESKDHVLRLDVPRTGLRVEADETRLAQVVANLLTNAAKFTNPGGVIEVSATREGAEVVIRVRDNGVGIATELLPHIFNIFTQGKRSLETTQGLGLGLALVRSFVRLHGGTVAATSEGVGRGAEFIVRLPAVEASVTIDAAVATMVAPAVVSATRVLVVDDNVDAAETLAALLRVRGYEVRTAYDGRQALDVARGFLPHVGIVDLGMPVIDGYQVAQELSLEPDCPHLIAVTGYGQEHDRIRSKAAGFDRHLVKPVAIQPLLAYLDALVFAV